MGRAEDNAGRNGGEYYTPRPLIRAMIQVVQPRIGESIYDGARGSAGFLCEAFEFLKGTEVDGMDGRGRRLTTKDLATVQTRTSTARRRSPPPTSSAS